MSTSRFLSCLAGVVCLGATTVHAQQHSVNLAAGVERIDNPGMTAVSPGGVTLYRLAPTYTYQDQGDRIRSRLTAGVVVEQSSDTALLPNRVYPALGYNWAYFWPTANLELRTNLTETSTRNTQFQEEGRITVDSKVRTLVAGGIWNQELTETTRLTLDLAGTDTKYDSPLLEDYQEWALSSRFTWAANERERYYFEPSYSRLDPSGTGAVSTRTRGLLGMNLELSPEWTLAGAAGMVHIGGEQVSTGPVGRIQLTYMGSRMSGDLEWSKDMSASGTAPGYVETRTSGARVGYRITEGATLSAGLTYAHSSGINGSRGYESRLALENELSAHLSSSLGLEARQTESASGVTAKGWAVRAGLVYAYPGR